MRGTEPRIGKRCCPAPAGCCCAKVVSFQRYSMIRATYSVESGGLNEDRAFMERRDKQTVAIICDGAGNSGRGGLAADLAIAELRRLWQPGFVDWTRALLGVD
jgi:serine/threonine protein phosphatase PrpC